MQSIHSSLNVFVSKFKTHSLSNLDCFHSLDSLVDLHHLP